MISADMIAEVMGFNRFYSNVLNLMNQQILAEGYLLTETRVCLRLGKQIDVLLTY